MVGLLERPGGHPPPDRFPCANEVLRRFRRKLPRTCRPAKDAWQRERETAGAEGASGSPDYGLTTKAGVGFTLRLLIDQCEVAAVMVRFTEDSEEQYRDLNKCERWEVVVPRGRG